MSKIIFSNSDGTVSVMQPVLTEINPATEKPFTIEEIAKKDVPDGVAYEIVEDSAIPTDRTFRNAWVKDDKTVKEDLTKAKVIGHTTRREKREEEFKPHDDIIAKQIPGKSATDAETARVAIRTKYATMQTNIDNATDTAGIKTALGG